MSINNFTVRAYTGQVNSGQYIVIQYDIFITDPDLIKSRPVLLDLHYEVSGPARIVRIDPVPPATRPSFRLTHQIILYKAIDDGAITNITVTLNVKDYPPAITGCQVAVNPAPANLRLRNVISLNKIR